MNEVFLRSWWMPGLRGLIAILFGLFTLFLPGLTLLGLTILFAVYALVSGFAAISGALHSRKTHEDWWLPFLFGLVSVAAGIIALVEPGLTLLVLVLLIAANALTTGMLDIVAAIRLRKTMHNEWLLILNGLASMAFGVLVFLSPGAGALALVWLIGIYTIVSGLLLLGLAYSVWHKTHLAQPVRDRRVTPDRRIATAHI
jgi:uncharacterized membrane protein HdeD (DUF308 family)